MFVLCIFVVWCFNFTDGKAQVTFDAEKINECHHDELQTNSDSSAHEPSSPNTCAPSESAAAAAPITEHTHREEAVALEVTPEQEAQTAGSAQSSDSSQKDTSSDRLEKDLFLASK